MKLCCTSSAHWCLYICKVSFIPRHLTHLAGGWGENCAYWCSALEAHGGSAGGLGHHIDLALTDTCREREVWEGGEERSANRSSLSSNSPRGPPMDGEHLLHCPLPTRPHPLRTLASLNACHRCTQYHVSKPGGRTENKQCPPQRCSSPPYDKQA